jgi:hypothetical protein
MKRNKAIALATAGALATLSMDAAFASPAPAPSSGASGDTGSSVTTIQFHSPPVVQTRLPEPSDPNAPLATGDRLFWTAELFKSGTRVGVIPHVCTVSDPRYLLCESTALLPKGQVQLQAVLDLTASEVGPVSIVGGSRCYRDVSGQVEVAFNDDGSSELTFRMTDACQR